MHAPWSTHPRGQWPRMYRMLVTALAAGSVLLGVWPTGSASADPSGDQARIDRELARTKSAMETASAQVRSAAMAYQRADEQLVAARERLAVANGTLAGAQVNVREAARALQAATTAAATAEQQARVAATVVDDARERVDRLAVDAYKGRGLATVNALLGASGPNDVAQGIGYLRRINSEEQARLAELAAVRAWAQARHDAAERARIAASRAQAATETAARAARAAAARAQTDERSVTALTRARADALAVARRHRQDTLDRYRRLQAESERIAAQIRGLARDGKRRFSPDTRLPMPVAGWKSSDFGMRFDPFYRVWQLHAGVDFAAGGGTPIRAVADGRVFRAGWNGGYGNYTCIYHGLFRGKGFATCYAHQSRLLASAGQWVRRGQVIGQVGTTGASTGYHLHFEVRLNGDPVDPLPWLVSCLC